MFKKENTYERRVELSKKLCSNFPDHIPIIITPNEYGDIQITKQRFLISKYQTVGSLIVEIRRYINNPVQTIFVFCNKNVLIPVNNTIEYIYEKYKDDDGFLYITISTENTFVWSMFNNVINYIYDAGSRISKTIGLY